MHEYLITFFYLKLIFKKLPLDIEKMIRKYIGIFNYQYIKPWVLSLWHGTRIFG